MSCTQVSAAVGQVLHYCMYLCAGIWDWLRAGTPVDLGFSPRAELRQVADSARNILQSLTIMNALKCSLCALVLSSLVLLLIAVWAFLFIMCSTQILYFCLCAAGMCCLLPCIGLMHFVPGDHSKKLKAIKSKLAQGLGMMV